MGADRGRPCASDHEDDVGVVRFSPLERVQNRTPEQVMVSPVPQIVEAVLPGQFLDSSMPQTMENSLPFAPQEHVQNRVSEQAVGVLVPQITEDGLPASPQERVQNSTLVESVGFPVPQITEEIRERVQDRTPELSIPVPQIVEEVPCGYCAFYTTGACAGSW